MAAQLELASSADFHEAMLKNDIDFEFDFSLDSLDSAQREAEQSQDGTLEHCLGTGETPVSEERANEKRPRSSSIDLRSLSDDVDGIFEGLNGGEGPLASEDGAKGQGSLQESEDDILLDREAFQKALNTTLCPAASKVDGVRPTRLLGGFYNCPGE